MEESEGPLSVWNLIVQHVPESELPEIRGLLGDALIDTYKEMHSEVTMWQEIRQTTRGSQQGNSSGPPQSPLPDPPVIKELLKAEIQLLLNTMRQRAEQEGRDGDADLFRYSPAVVNYALNGPGNRSDSGVRLIQSQQCERPCSRISLGSTMSQEDVDVVIHKLRVTHIDDIVAHLKSVLTEECEALKSQVQFLQESVELEHQQYATETPEPTVTELKEARRAIQMDLKSHICGPLSPVETSSSGTSRLTYLTTAETERHLEPPPPHYRPCPPPSETLVRTPLNRVRGQPCSSPNPGEHSSLQNSEHPRTHRQRTVTSRPCDPVCNGVTLQGHVLSYSTLTTPNLNPSPAQDAVVMARTGRTSGQPVTSDSATIRTFLFPGGHRTLGPSLQRLWTAGTHEEISPVDMFLPVPPAAQRPARRGRSEARCLCPPQGDRLVGSS